MRKTIAAALAAITFTGALIATAAEARPRHHYHRDRDNDGAAIAAGIAGLAIGAALASGSRDRSSYYDRGYYDRPYYGGYYDRRYYSPPRYSYYGPRRDYRHCRTVSRWDPYYGGYTRSTRCW